jgi:hypothetical protein
MPTLTLCAVNESPAQPNDAVWSVVRGPSPGANAVAPATAGVPVPDAVLAWAREHSLGEPGTRLLVTAADEAGFVAGQVAFLWHPLTAAEMARLRAVLAGLTTRG